MRVSCSYLPVSCLDIPRGVKKRLKRPDIVTARPARGCQLFVLQRSSRKCTVDGAEGLEASREEVKWSAEAGSADAACT
jgi:hypothetical protein